MAEHAHDPHARDQHHVVPLKIYYGIFGILLLLTGVTVAVAYIDLGRMNTVVALAIACFKAIIVALFFMHVKYSTRLIKLTVIAGLYWLGILFALTMSDYLTRAMGTFGQQISLR
jgi:cytochrome c oxidase subunit IV